jgi:hypothetical protein
MRTFAVLVLGMILGVAAIVAGVYFYFATGQAPVATSASAMPFEKMLAHKALDAIVEREMPKTAPIQPDEANLAAGATLYREHCAVCHGLPQQKETFYRRRNVSASSQVDARQRRYRRRTWRDLLEGCERNSPDGHAGIPTGIV